jgi:hypothetical protein
MFCEREPPVEPLLPEPDEEPLLVELPVLVVPLLLVVRLLMPFPSCKVSCSIRSCVGITPLEAPLLLPVLPEDVVFALPEEPVLPLEPNEEELELPLPPADPPVVIPVRRLVPSLKILLVIMVAASRALA